MNALDPKAQALLALLVSRLSKVVPGQPETYIGYKEAHEALHLEYLGPTYGESLKKQGLLTLANWVLAEKKPAITGIIVDTTSYVPAKGYFDPYGKTEDDFDWWTEQVRLSKSFDWGPYLSSATAARRVIQSDQPLARYWWDHLGQEKYWVEITARSELVLT